MHTSPGRAWERDNASALSFESFISQNIAGTMSPGSLLTRLAGVRKCVLIEMS